ncbi:hypothetical protein Amet_2396 [Alkaliphilus metalliredigens QYMF]|uniref:Uncharacterized protein n=1 Tax=Alkaliphilus metalliredigens (strain QYMF) TaxID=293826 RepID=A6TQT2_ALKMQ|nr:DUF2303 family protein [Alkaliphilus metalliredigens]ABR48550.1 hypothetical protein Amet_2396 [Alkaliphilus metalliredigens QYMF]
MEKATNTTNVKVEVKEGTETLKLIHEPMQTRKIHEWNKRDYDLESLQAVIDLVERKGTLENSMIFYSTSSIRVILDDSIQDRPLDHATYKFQISDELHNWKQVFGQRLKQKELVDFLKRLDDDEVQNREELIMNVRKLQVMTEIKGEYRYDDDGNVSVMYKESNGREGLMALPRYIFITLPILNEGDHKPTLELELELIKPKAEDEKPAIVITCPKLKKHMDDAVKCEIDKLKSALPEHLIIAGRD